MGYTSSTKVWGTDQLLWNSMHLEDSALVLNDGNTKPIVQMMGGVYRSSLPTYTNGDAAVPHFTADGKLMVDTELTLSSATIDNIFTYSTDNTAANARYGLVDANGHVQVDVLSSAAPSGSQGTLTTVLNAKGSTGRDSATGVDVSAFKWIIVSVVGANSADLTVKCEGSIDTDDDFSTNDNDFIQMRELQDGVAVAGDTGVVFSGSNDTILYNVEVGGLSYINFNVTSWTAGDVTVKIRGFNN